MIAYKFLRIGRVSPFTKRHWPVAGETSELWLDRVTACTAADLPLWIDDELWVVELAGGVTEDANKLSAERGRLLRRIPAWNRGSMGDFALACAMRARDHALWALRRDDSPAARRTLRALSEAFTARAIVDATGDIEASTTQRSRLAVGFAADAAESAMEDAAATAAYVAAHSAGMIRSEAAVVAERRWQADWLADRLDLPDRHRNSGMTPAH